MVAGCGAGEIGEKLIALYYDPTAILLAVGLK
jgi:hypothetical protein